ncbi:E3-CR1-alpha [Titi monkey adenovirus ECC-2011]|uniref:E3-CR1-alpha n=1 Tax=titi monkey adenovirus 1 TaxID=3123084 RepID=G0ZAJ2_9ADEN|nr:E3-CR1-alpha [Titi monkey adenovirus ECC-2011]AEK98463.1 E3-CR1-alpha [Titi monkey adenovirus ECC-2011]
MKSCLSVCVLSSILLLALSSELINLNCTEQPATRGDLFYNANGSLIVFLQCPNHSSLSYPIHWSYNFSVPVANFTPAVNATRQPPLLAHQGWNETVANGVESVIVLENPPEGVYCCLSNLTVCSCWNFTDFNRTLEGFSTTTTLATTTTSVETTSTAVATTTATVDLPLPEGAQEGQDFYFVEERETHLQLDSKFWTGLTLGLVLFVSLVLLCLVEYRRNQVGDSYTTQEPLLHTV